MQAENIHSTVSVIIPTKNEGDMLQNCLRSISNQSVHPVETIVVDGGSTDDTVNVANRFDAKVLVEQGFSSPANARNLGATVARGDILLIIDADVILDSECIRCSLKVFEDKDVIAVLPSEMNVDHSYIEMVQRRWNEGSRSSASIGLGETRTSGLVAFFRKEVFEKVKFDIKYGFGEDDDFTTRIKSEFKGYKIMVSEDCRVISHSPHTIREFASRYSWWGRTFFSYLSNHFSLRSILNLGSLLLPLATVITLFFWMAFALLLPLLLALVFLFVAEILIVCVRSRSVLFFQFAVFDLARSLFFAVGLIESPFVPRKGR